MTLPQQLTLELAFRPAMRRQDFLVSDCNRAAFLSVTDTRQTRLALSGPKGSGKTHLASVWGEAVGAVRLDHFSDTSVAALADVSAVVIEDADKVAGSAAEALLFHALNLTAAEQTQVLLTGKQPPSLWPVKTPDLASRLAAFNHVSVSPPDDELLSSVLIKLFQDRRLTVGPDVVMFVVRRMERSFAAAERLVELLDRFALSEQRPITRPLAKKLFDTVLNNSPERWRTE